MVLPNGVAALGARTPAGRVVLVADALTRQEQAAARVVVYALLVEHAAVLVKMTTLARIIEDAA